MPRTRTDERVPVPHALRSEIMARCGNRCARCGKNLLESGDGTVEHVIPLSKGGTYDPENLVMLCKRCNQGKSDDIVRPAAFYASLSPERRKKLQRMVDRYCDETDWLDGTHLFRLDDFEARLHLARNALLIARVTKLRRQQVVDFMTRYVEKYGAFAATPTSVEQVARPFYRIELQGKTVMLVSPYITDGTERFVARMRADEMGSEILGRMSRAFSVFLCVVDIYVNPDIKDNGALTDQLLGCVLNDVVARGITETFTRKRCGILVPVLMASPRPDRLAERGLVAFATRTGIPFEDTDWLRRTADYAHAVCRITDDDKWDHEDYAVLMSNLGDEAVAARWDKRADKIDRQLRAGKIDQIESYVKMFELYADFWGQFRDRTVRGRTEMSKPVSRAAKNKTKKKHRKK